LTSKNNKLAIGTAQFGMPYGITNKKGQVEPAEAKKILDFAKENGIDTLDTAAGYGNSEQLLGESGVSGWQIVTKIGKMDPSCPDIGRWVRESIEASLRRLNVSSLYGVLFHVPAQLEENFGPALYQALVELKAENIVSKIGISIYSPEELDTLLEKYSFDIVQAPFNVFDRRLEESGWLQRLAERGIEVHIRSVFLQGLLLMDPAERPPKFNRWQSLWDAYDSWINATRYTRLEACINHVLNYPQINKVVVGVASMSNLKEIIQAVRPNIGVAPAGITCNELDLVHPSRW